MHPLSPSTGTGWLIVSVTWRGECPPPLSRSGSYPQEVPSRAPLTFRPTESASTGGHVHMSAGSRVDRAVTMLSFTCVEQAVRICALSALRWEGHCRFIARTAGGWGDRGANCLWASLSPAPAGLEVLRIGACAPVRLEARLRYPGFDRSAGFGRPLWSFRCRWINETTDTFTGTAFRIVNFDVIGGRGRPS